MATVYTGTGVTWPGGRRGGDSMISPSSDVSSSGGGGSSGSSSSFGKYLLAGADVFSGFSSYFSGKRVASVLDQQGALTQNDYYRQANLVREEGHRFRAKQTMQYISSGVEVVGTPLLVMKETMTKAAAKARALEVSGRNANKMYKMKASQAKEEGMASLISGVLSAGSLFI